MINVVLNNVADLTNTVTAQSTINTNSNTITAAFTSALNTTGDKMNGTLDMNSNQIINLPQPLSNSSPLRLSDAATLSGGGTISSIPLGGGSGQVLTKNSSTNYDASWLTPVSALTGGTGITVATGGIILSTTAVASGSYGNASNVATFTVNAQGQLTAASSTAISVVASATSLAGTTLATGVTTSSLAVLGTVTTGVWNGTIITGTYGGTGVNNGTSSITIANPLVVTGAFPTTLTVTATTNVTLPTTGTLINSTSPTINTPNIVGITGTTNATVGSWGEFISTSLVAASAIALVSGTASQITTMNLTAGDWDLWGQCISNIAATTSMTYMYGAVSTLTTPSAAITLTAPSPTQEALSSWNGVNTGNNVLLCVCPIRVNVASTTAVYLYSQMGFSVGTAGAYGWLAARRVR